MSQNSLAPIAAAWNPSDALPACIALSHARPSRHRAAASRSGWAGHGSETRDLSRFLLALYAQAHDCGIGEFEQHFFLSLADYLDFDAAWTGVATPTRHGPIIHSSFTYGLSEDFFSTWQSIRQLDPLVQDAKSLSGQACAVSAGARHVAPGFRQWAGRYRLAHLMVVCVQDHRRGLAAFVSLYRKDAKRPFSSDDKRKLDDVAPHVAAALSINRAKCLDSTRVMAHVPPIQAFCDYLGAIHHADEGFLPQLAQEWPDMAGSYLPWALIEHIRRSPGQPYEGQALRVHCQPVMGLVQLQLERRSPLERLSPRERLAVCHYGEGLSYKQVAQRLEITPATVRHYLRSAYKKLGIQRKGQIAGLLRGDGWDR